jgi:hypothetical protein
MRKTPCEEKARLLRRCVEAESHYNLAIHVLSTDIRSLEKPYGNELEDFAVSGRRMVEGAQDALERHTDEHGANAGASRGRPFRRLGRRRFNL